MNHLDDARLLAVRDGDGAAADLAHLEDCGACSAMLETARARSGVVAGALETLDVQWDVEAARAAVRARVTEDAARAAGAMPLRSRTHRTAWWGGSRAAAVVVLLAATASALPGSPVRDWLSTVLTGPDGPEPVETMDGATRSAPSSVESAEEAAPAATGIRLRATAPLRVNVRGLPAGGEIEVRWVVGDEVAIFAPVGSRFTSSDGSVEALVTRGPVTVEIPRTTVPATLEVGGRIYLRRTGDGLDVSGPVVSRTDAAVTFRLP